MAMPKMPDQLASGTMAHQPITSIAASSQRANGSSTTSLRGQVHPHALPNQLNTGSNGRVTPYSPMTDAFVSSLQGRAAVVVIGPQKVSYSIPVGLLTYHSNALLKMISRETTKMLNDKAAQNDESKKRKLSADDEYTGSEDSYIIRSSDQVLHTQDTRLPAPMIMLAEAETAVFNLFLKFIYHCSYPPLQEGLPVAGQMQTGECYSISVRAWLFAFDMEACSFLNYAMQHIFVSVGNGNLKITPALFEYVWTHTKQQFSINGKLYGNPLQTLFMDLLIVCWPQKQNPVLYRSGSCTDLQWTNMIGRHPDLFQYFMQGLSQNPQMRPLVAYLVQLDQSTGASTTASKLPQRKTSTCKPTAAGQASKKDLSTSQPPQKNPQNLVAQAFGANTIIVNVPPQKDRAVEKDDSTMSNKTIPTVKEDAFILRQDGTTNENIVSKTGRTTSQTSSAAPKDVTHSSGFNKANSKMQISDRRLPWDMLQPPNIRKSLQEQHPEWTEEQLRQAIGVVFTAQCARAKRAATARTDAEGTAPSYQTNSATPSILATPKQALPTLNVLSHSHEITTAPFKQDTFAKPFSRSKSPSPETTSTNLQARAKTNGIVRMSPLREKLARWDENMKKQSGNAIEADKCDMGKEEFGRAVTFSVDGQAGDISKGHETAMEIDVGVDAASKHASKETDLKTDKDARKAYLREHLARIEEQKKKGEALSVNKTDKTDKRSMSKEPVEKAASHEGHSELENTKMDVDIDMDAEVKHSPNESVSKMEIE